MVGNGTESAEARLKRMRMRSWRRGTKEMDLVLGPWADARLAGLSAAELEVYDALLGENDQDIFPWILGTQPCPERYAALIAEVADFARRRMESAAL
ncbi:FAD assembly factor SdhE [Phaeovulum vinaykumarii]|uniref:FAD assembly factor SdhE n=1 Tax=Phaeovulum vinaykumarii TaxID=407234 RepID=A0A1N7LUE6_9RHOB|nr:succinate dehydrogenase assembly factor 2 [Phaeovulum vinaykumarii]SIS77467.1 antitoxin CptB [Phaeovulum vinaykumarii]SOC07424.1 antitoxin CptB [Phaeovulum vinaykumarii]